MSGTVKLRGVTETGTSVILATAKIDEDNNPNTWQEMIENITLEKEPTSAFSAIFSADIYLVFQVKSFAYYQVFID